MNFILYGFLKKLRIYFKIVVCGNLGMSVSAHPRWYYQFVEKFCVYLQAKNSVSCFSGDNTSIWKLILGTIKNETIKLWKTSMFFCMPKMLVWLNGWVFIYELSGCRYDSRCCHNKVRHSLLPWDYIWKNSGILLADSIWNHNWRPRFLLDMGQCWNINNNISFYFRLFPRKTKDKIFHKSQKILFWGHFDLFCRNLGKH